MGAGVAPVKRTEPRDDAPLLRLPQWNRHGQPAASSSRKRQDALTSILAWRRGDEPLAPERRRNTRHRRRVHAEVVGEVADWHVAREREGHHQVELVTGKPRRCERAVERGDDGAGGPRHVTEHAA